MAEHPVYGEGDAVPAPGTFSLGRNLSPSVTATAEAPAPAGNAVVATKSRRPLVPPEEKFWQRYNKHGEFPLSSITSFALHALIAVLLLFGAWLAVKLGLASMQKSPEVSAIVLAEKGGGGGNPNGVGEGPGDTPAPPEDVKQPTDPRKTGTAVQLPELPESDVDPVKLPNFKDAEGNRVIEASNRAVQAVAALNEQARTKIFNGLAPSKGKDGPGKGGGEGAGDGPKKGPGTGDKKGNLSQRQKRVLRWTMIFNTLNGEDYARQLNSLGAILAVPEPDGKQYRVLRDLGQRPATGDVEDLSKIQSIYWVDDKPESVAGLSRALGLNRPTHIVAFFPAELENKLAKLEADFKGLKEDDIAETRFDIKRTAGGYEPVVVFQTKLR